MIGELKLIASRMDGEETIGCQMNCFSVNHFYKTVDNKVIEFPRMLMSITYTYLRSQNAFFLHEFKKYCFFLHKTIEKPYLNLYVKFHDFFP